MDKYQITATIEKINCTNDIQLQLKGCGKCFFEPENDKSVKYNILECLQTYTPIPQTYTPIPKPILLNSKKDFFSIKDNVLTNNSLSQAFIENKRLKFEVKEDSGKYNITSISKAD